MEAFHVSEPIAIPQPELRKLLLRLMEEVESSQREAPELRAEVLLSINQHCSPDLLVALWHIIEAVEPRQEMLVVRLVRDIDSDRLDASGHALLQDEDPLRRAIGYGIIAMRARHAGARVLAEALGDDIALILKKGGRSELAPYSFLTCVLAGLREFKDRTLDAIAPEILHRFANGEDDLDILHDLLQDFRPPVAKFGFVALASRVMGLVHRAAYDYALRHQRKQLLDPQERRWLGRALLLAPEIIEAITEAGPARMDAPELILGRLVALTEIDEDEAAHFLTGLLSGDMVLPSLFIESRLHPDEHINYEELATFRRHSIAYLFALIIQHRPLLSLFMEALSQQGELETLVLERLINLSGPNGALNTSMAVVSYWLMLDPRQADDRAFREWLARTLHDPGPDALSARIDLALASPTHEAFYALRLIASVHDDFGILTLHMLEGRAVPLSQLQPHLGHPRLVPAIYALLNHGIPLHVTTLRSIARAGLDVLLPALRYALSRDPLSPQREPIEAAITLLEATRAAAHHEIFQMLGSLGLEALDRQYQPGLLRTFFFFPVPGRPLGERIATAEFVLDADLQIEDAYWSDSEGAHLRSADLPVAPPSLAGRLFKQLRWGLPLEQLEGALESAGGQSLSQVLLESGHTRVLIELAGQTLRLDFDTDQGLIRALRPTPHSAFKDALAHCTRALGPHTFQGEERAYWFYPEQRVILARALGYDVFVESLEARSSPSLPA